MDLPEELFEYPNDNISILEVMNEEYTNEFMVLPNEMINHLNSFLNYQDVRRYAQTCSHINNLCQESIKAKREQLKPLLYNCAASPLGRGAQNKLQYYLMDTQKFTLRTAATLKSLQQQYTKLKKDKTLFWGGEADKRLFVFLPNIYFETADSINDKLLIDATKHVESGCVRFTCICGFQVHMVDGLRFGGSMGTMLRHFQSDIHLQRLFAYNYTYLGTAEELALPYGSEEHMCTNMEEYVYPKGYLTLTA